MDATITADTLRRIAGASKPHPLMTPIAEAINKYAGQYGVTSQADLGRFLANSCVETANFTRLEENMNYSAQRLCDVWPKRFPTLASAKPYANNPQALANKVYGERLGNKGKPDAGWLYRGSGAKQTTGYDNFLEVEKETGVSVTKNPDLLRTDPDLAVRAAFIFWKNRNLSKVTDITAGRKIINGGTNGLSEVKAAFARAMKLPLSVPTASQKAPEVVAKPVSVSPIQEKPIVSMPPLPTTQKPVKAGPVAAIVGAMVAAGYAISQYWCDYIGLFCN